MLVWRETRSLVVRKKDQSTGLLQSVWGKMGGLMLSFITADTPKLCFYCIFTFQCGNYKPMTL